MKTTSPEIFASIVVLLFATAEFTTGGLVVADFAAGDSNQLSANHVAQDGCAATG